MKSRSCSDRSNINSYTSLLTIVKMPSIPQFIRCIPPPLPTPRELTRNPANLSGLAPKKQAPLTLAGCPQSLAAPSGGHGANVSGGVNVAAFEFFVVSMMTSCTRRLKKQCLTVQSGN